MSISRTLFFFLAIASSSALFAQHTTDTPLERIPVGVLEGGEAVLTDYSEATRDWVLSHFRRDLKAPQEAAIGYEATIQFSERSGWNYLSTWTQGEEQITARFQLHVHESDLLLPKLGSFQACICTTCTEAPAFAYDAPGCACESGADCRYVMGEWLD